MSHRYRIADWAPERTITVTVREISNHVFLSLTALASRRLWR